MRHLTLRGLDLHAPTNELVENNSGGGLTQLTVVRLNGIGTLYPQVITANPSVASNFGIIAADIPTGSSGFACAVGFLLNVNTNAWPVGTLLYSDASGVLNTTPLGSPAAFVVKQDATLGVLYVTTLADAQVLQTAWGLYGNATGAANFLGTTNADDLRFRTANIQRMILDQNGRLGIGTATPHRLVEIKSHASIGSTGLEADSFAVDTSSAGFNVALSVPIQDPSAVRIEFVVSAREVGGGNYASFKRTALFYRNSSNVQILGGSWQSDHTQKTSNTMNVSFTLSPTSVTFSVKPDSSAVTRWAGYVLTQEVF